MHLHRAHHCHLQKISKRGSLQRRRIISTRDAGAATRGLREIRGLGFFAAAAVAVGIRGVERKG
jgi:hypothetical protein